jgi:hypothetical protein
MIGAGNYSSRRNRPGKYVIESFTHHRHGIIPSCRHYFDHLVGASDSSELGKKLETGSFET